MDHLRTAVADWRRRLEGESEAELDREQLDELEAHLLDSAETLQRAGLDAQEAVLVAARRLGPGAALGDEYAKVHPEAGWLRRAQWMLVGYLTLSALLLAARLASDTAAGLRPARSVKDRLVRSTSSSAKLVHLRAAGKAIRGGWHGEGRACGKVAASWLEKRAGEFGQAGPPRASGRMAGGELW